jgi:hypothetical protein
MAVTSGKRRARPKNKAGRKMKVKKTVKRRSAAAASLASPVFRKRVVRSAKAYSRKGRAKTQGGESEEA